MNVLPSNTSHVTAVPATAPRLAAPIGRSTYADADPMRLQSGSLPSCTQAQNNAIGQCFDANGPVPGRFNCAACCALRGAVVWHDPSNGDVVDC